MNNLDIGKELKSLSNAIARYLDRQQCHHDMLRISGPNGWILNFLYENQDRDIYQKDLEEEFGVTRSTASKVLILMERKNLIKRVPVAHDARLKKILMTDEAKSLSENMKADAERVQAKLTDGFSEDEMEKLCEFIHRMKDNMSK